MHPNTFNKVFTGLVFFLSLFYAFWLGVDVQRGDTKEIIADAVLLGFWLFALAFIVAMNRHERKLDKQLQDAEKNLHHALGDVFSEIERDMEQRKNRRQEFADLFKEVTGKDFYEAKTLSAKHKAKIEKLFNERTGLYANVVAHKGGKIEVEVSDQKPATKKAPVKKPVAPKTPAPTTKKAVTKKGK